jgi:DNA-binding transcriptional regulator GbsR (MarR family)
MEKVDVTSAMVIRGLYDCLRRSGREPVTAAEIAMHLEVGEREVGRRLRELKSKRIVRDYMRKGRRVWEPWS